MVGQPRLEVMHDQELGHGIGEPLGMKAQFNTIGSVLQNVMASALHFLGWSISCHPAAAVGQPRLQVMHDRGLENPGLVHQLGHG